MLNILWFRRDLRISDHLPLLMAVSDGFVAPLVIVEPDYWAQPYASARQWRFAARAITALRSQLAVIGAPLIVRTGEATEVIAALQEKSKDVSIWSHDTVGSRWEAARDARVTAWIEEMGIPWHRMADTGGPWSVEGASDPWTQVLAEPPVVPPDLMIAHGVLPGRVVSERILYLDDDPCEDLPAGPAGARRVLDAFMDAAEAGDAGPTEIEEAIAGLAPHLAWGTLSARETWNELERLKPDADEIACAMQDRLLDMLAPVSDEDMAETDADVTPSLEVGKIGDAISDVPVLSAAFSTLQTHGIIREDLLWLMAQCAASRLSCEAQTVLDALAPLRTAYVEARRSIVRLPEGAGSADTGSDLGAALAAIDPGRLAAE